MVKTSLSQFLNDLSHGVYNFTQNGKCSECGNCCTALLPVTKEEVKTIKRYIKRKGVKPIKNDIDIDLTCPFRNEKERICNIYEVRPYICRSFICSKMQNDIDREKEKLNFDKRFSVINMREYFC